MIDGFKIDFFSNLFLLFTGNVWSLMVHARNLLKTFGESTVFKRISDFELISVANKSRSRQLSLLDDKTVKIVLELNHCQTTSDTKHFGPYSETGTLFYSKNSHNDNLLLKFPVCYERNKQLQFLK